MADILVFLFNISNYFRFFDYNCLSSFDIYKLIDFWGLVLTMLSMARGKNDKG